MANDNNTQDRQNGSVGAALKEARLARGLTLEQAEAETNIRARYLEAVESGNFDKTPGEVFVRGIIRTYGNYLGLDGQKLVADYKAQGAGGAAAKSVSGIREVDKVQMKVQLKDKRDIGSGTGKIELPSVSALPLKQIAAGAVLAALLAGGWLFADNIGGWLAALPKTETKQELPAQKPQEAADKPASSAYASDKVTVEMTAGDKCWLEVTADGKEIYAGMLQPQDKRKFEAADKLVIKYGNVGVMQVKVNGEPDPMDGEHGVAVKTYTKK